MSIRRFSAAVIATVTFTMWARSADPVAAQELPSLNPAPNAPAGAAEPVQLSGGVEDILKLSRAKIGDDVTVAFIQNSGRRFDLTASEILYLRQEGVSERVLAAMLNHQPRPAPSKQPAAPAPAPPAGAPQYVADIPPPTMVNQAPLTSNATSDSASYYSSSYPYYTYPYYTYPYYSYSYSYPYYYYYPYYCGYPRFSLGFAFGSGYGYYGGYYGSCYKGGGYYYGKPYYGGGHCGKAYPNGNYYYRANTAGRWNRSANPQAGVAAARPSGNGGGGVYRGGNWNGSGSSINRSPPSNASMRPVGSPSPSFRSSGSSFASVGRASFASGGFSRGGGGGGGGGGRRR